MDYKERLIELLNSEELSSKEKERLKELFPELDVSEDERMIKELIAMVEEDWPGRSDVIAWLEKQGEKPAQQVQKILNSIGEDATWLVVSVFCNGRGWRLFRNGRKIEEKDLTEREREWLESWIFAMYNGGGLFKKRKRK